MNEHTFFSTLADLIESGADILFPRSCAACGRKLFEKYERKMCSKCRSDIAFIRLPLCRICGMELAGDIKRNHICGGCLRYPPSFVLARSVVRYSRPVQKLLYGLKYGADTTVLPGIAELLSQFDLTPFEQCDYIIPVPLHLRKLRQRGLNQSVLLAKLIFSGKTESILQTDFLIRAKNTVPQTTLNGVKRRKNLAGAFVVARKADVEQKTICLVDHVYTTGTTVSECSKVLCRQGAKEVRVVTFTRVELTHSGR